MTTERAKQSLAPEDFVSTYIHTYNGVRQELNFQMALRHKLGLFPVQWHFLLTIGTNGGATVVQRRMYI